MPPLYRSLHRFNTMPPDAPGSLVPNYTAPTPDAPPVLVDYPMPYVAAAATIAITSFVDGDRYTIGGIAYVRAAADGAGNVFAEAAGLARNINGGKSGVAAHALVSATSSGNSVFLTARTAGLAGNSITIGRNTGAAMHSNAPQHLLNGLGMRPAAPSPIHPPYTPTAPDAPDAAVPGYTCPEPDAPDAAVPGYTRPTPPAPDAAVPGFTRPTPDAPGQLVPNG